MTAPPTAAPSSSPPSAVPTRRPTVFVPQTLWDCYSGDDVAFVYHSDRWVPTLAANHYVEMIMHRTSHPLPPSLYSTVLNVTLAPPTSGTAATPSIQRYLLPLPQVPTTASTQSNSDAPS